MGGRSKPGRDSVPRPGEAQLRLAGALSVQSLVLPYQVLQIREARLLQCLPARVVSGCGLAQHLVQVDCTHDGHATVVALRNAAPKVSGSELGTMQLKFAH